MKGKSLLLLVVAMGCGLVAMLGVQQALKANKGQETEMVSVLVATADIPSGIAVDDTNTTFKEFPADTVPEGAVRTVEQYEERALKSEAVAGEIIMVAKLGEKGVIGASAEIPKGMRVVTVSVTDTTTHAGQMAPGDRVDVIVTYDTRDQDTREALTKSRTILNFIKVFSVGNKRDGLGEAAEFVAKNVSLLVTPQQAQLIMLAKNKGTLHLAMRSKLDVDDAKAMPIDDRIFEDWDGVMNEEQLTAENEKIKDERTAEEIRAALLDEQIHQETVPTSTQAVKQPEPEPEPPKPTWEVAIFAGKNKTIETFELSDDSSAVKIDSQRESNDGRKVPADELKTPDFDLRQLDQGLPAGNPGQKLKDLLQKQLL